ncbi:heat shock factor protein-like [Diaphorina citri]|uniref:Heat shock factor protein-like n=1 Tax=Diaphorina citri TaxID=121845 RepID=A0A3Q0JGS3_DIACI|nr:heat shock factor protein-like [Diaphorina citri]
MKGRQESFDNKLSSMKQENEALWRELSILRQKHMKQQQIVNKTENLLGKTLLNSLDHHGPAMIEDDGLTLINFLVSLVQPSRNGLSVKKMNLPMIKGRREHTDSFCSDDSNYDSITMMDKVQVMSGDEHDNSPPGPTIHELDSPDFLEDIDILQGTDNTLTSPWSYVLLSEIFFKV